VPRPLVTIAVVSCNRLHYLRALLESARECIRYEPIQWIIVDNASVEPGLREYVEGLDFVQHKILRERRSPSTEHVEAMNAIVDLAEGEYLMIQPEDMQFVVRGRWLEDFVELLRDQDGIGTLTFDAQRRATLRRHFGPRPPWRAWLPGGRRRRYRTGSGREFLGYGRSALGISPAGIGTFARTALWRRIGPWKAPGRQTVADSSGGGEAEMERRFAALELGLERCLPRLPVCADIITDPLGSKARIRGNRRYGAYFAPPQGSAYYRIRDEAELGDLLRLEPAVGFEDLVVPLGFTLPIDAAGSLRKEPHQREDDDFEWIHPDVAGREPA
jgi:hypothetical protein